MGKVLIITDGAASIQKMAEAITAALDGYDVTVTSAEKCKGTQLLAADICFFGSETPAPPSFSCLHKMLEHVNLAGRFGGVFAASKQAAEYLCGMVHDSELILAEPFLGEGDIKDWAGTAARLNNQTTV